MILNLGHAYFVKDSFFEAVNDPYLKQDKGLGIREGKRPHFYALQDSKSALVWLVPVSSKIPKYQKIIDTRNSLGKPSDTIQIFKVHGRNQVFLFQDMFPTLPSYIQSAYLRNGQPVFVSNPSDLAKIEKTATKISKMLLRGVKFTPTQPNIIRIQETMLAELKQQEHEKSIIEKPSIQQQINAATKKAAQTNANRDIAPLIPQKKETEI